MAMKLRRKLKSYRSNLVIPYIMFLYIPMYIVSTPATPALVERRMTVFPSICKQVRATLTVMPAS